MKLGIILSLSIVLIGSSSLAEEKPSVSKLTEDALAQWDSFKLKHNKRYANDADEQLHQQAYVKNYIRIERHNHLARRGLRSYEAEINHLADLLPEELKMFTGYRSASHNRKASTASLFTPQPNASIPEKVDWRKKGLVTRIKNQANCGSCWAFGTVGSLEAAQAKATGKLIELSEQQLVDCSRKFGNNGCYGGLPNLAFDYIIQSGGIDTEESYPYTARARVRSYVNITMGDEHALKEAVATVGPISVGICCEIMFFFYKKGIYYDHYCSSAEYMLNHAVVVVGYGSDHWTGDFWIVKNSWGTSWGEDGYIRMTRNKNNNCGIATDASYPIVEQ